MTSMETVTTFEDHSQAIVSKFLQTAVAVDNEMGFGAPEPIVGELADPGEDDNGQGVTEDSIDYTADEQSQSHYLDYSALSKSFADNGIICSGLQPTVEDPDDKITYIFNSAVNSDLTILDWEMGDKGDIAIGSIVRLAKHDFESNGRLRLICVYTGVNHASLPVEVINPILTNLRDSGFTAEHVDNTDHIDVSKDQTNSFWRICVISKVGVGNSGVSEEQLPSELVKRFTVLTSGLLSNAAISALTEVRESANSFLGKFNKSLDTAYISHLLGLISLPDSREKSHEVAFDYAVGLISEEIKSRLQISTMIKDTLSEDVIQSWLQNVNPRNRKNFFNLQLNSREPCVFGNDIASRLLAVKNDDDLKVILHDVLNISHVTVDGKTITANQRFKNDPVKLSFNSEANDNIDKLLDLCAIEVTRRDITSVSDEHIPVLKQGTVLKQGSKYYICIQPLCDTVRLSRPTFFTFIEAKRDSGSFTHVLRATNGFNKIKINPSSKNIRTYKFQVNNDAGCALGEKSGNKLIFTEVNNDGANGLEFEWIGEFKDGIANSLANQASSNVSRVGIDTFEWLRLRQ